MRKTNAQKVSNKSTQGYKSALSGALFEQKVATHFSQKGWTVHIRKQTTNGEIDVYGEKLDKILGTKEYLLVECKRQEHVSAKDVMHFMKKLTSFYQRLPTYMLSNKPPVEAWIAHTGSIDEDAIEVAPRGFKPKIKFKQF